MYLKGRYLLEGRISVGITVTEIHLNEIGSNLWTGSSLVHRAVDLQDA